jgi:N-acylglucosamine 2-epimerase
MDLTSLKKRFERNLFESVIPFWERYSLDPEHGGQMNCLTREGRIYDPRKYVWMNGRAAWMFARLYNTVEKRETWIEASRSAVEFLFLHAHEIRGRCYFSLTREGRPVFIQRKPYSAFFVALALIEYHKTGGPQIDDYLGVARRIFSCIREWMVDASLLDRPVLDGQTPVRQLSDIMVIASLAMEFLSVEKDQLYRDLLEQCLGDVRAHWLASHRTLLENLPLDGTDYRSLPDTRLLCPGSAIEVAWFLLHVIETLGEPRPADEQFLYDVIEGSLEYGWDREHGGIYYFMDAEGLPALQLEASMKLWWPHTEALYALILAWSKTQDPKWLDWLERVDEYTFRTFADWEFGEWFGYCDREGRVINSMKGGPYKGFFHVPRCLLFSLQRLRNLG